MGRLILCYAKKADKPYYIKNMNINLYTIEELCYYLYHNIYLIDENIINDDLIEWIDKELELGELSELLNRNRGSFKTMIMNILDFTGNISQSDIDETDKLLSRLDGQTDVEKELARADHLLQYKMYVEAILEYMTLADLVDESLKEKVWNNMGVAYAGMFHFGEAAKCFKNAYEIKRDSTVYKQFLYAVSMACRDEVTELIQDIHENYEEILKEELEKLQNPDINSSLEQFNQVLNLKKENQVVMYYKGLEELLNEWKKEYTSLSLSVV